MAQGVLVGLNLGAQDSAMALRAAGKAMISMGLFLFEKLSIWLILIVNRF
jgi:hypothetical protein